MATTKTMPKAKSTQKTSAKAPAAKAKVAESKPAKAPRPRLSLPQVMGELEKAGSAQTRKTYTRHGASEPMFGVSFATLKTMTKRIGVDHELACALWDTGNFDARNLAVKIVDPERMKSADLDRWIKSPMPRMCGGYAAMLPTEQERPSAERKATQWLDSKNERERSAGWVLLGQVAQRDESLPDAWFEKHLARIVSTLHSASNSERYMMNGAVIAIGLRNARLRKLATAAAKKIGTVEVDHGDTACETPDAAASIDKAWTYSTSRGFESPAAAERKRDVPRLRC